MNRCTPGLPVHHQLLEFTQIHVHRVGDAIQPSHPLLSPSPPAPNPSQHQSLFQWVNSSHEVTEVLEFQLQHQSFQWIPRTYSLVAVWYSILFLFLSYTNRYQGFPGVSFGKQSSCNAWEAGRAALIPGSGRSPGGGHGNPLLENLTDRGAWQATVHWVKKELDMTE